MTQAKRQATMADAFLYIYVNGTEVYRQDLTTSPNSTAFTTSNFTVGDNSNVTYVETCPATIPCPIINIRGVTLVPQLPTSPSMSMPASSAGTAVPPGYATTITMPPSTLTRTVTTGGSTVTLTTVLPASTTTATVVSLAIQTVTTTVVTVSNGQTVVLTTTFTAPSTTVTAGGVVSTCYLRDTETICATAPPTQLRPTSPATASPAGSAGMSATNPATRPMTTSGSAGTPVSNGGVGPSASMSARPSGGAQPSGGMSPNPAASLAMATRTRTMCYPANTVYVTAWPSWYTPGPGLYQTGSLLYMAHG